MDRLSDEENTIDSSEPSKRRRLSRDSHNQSEDETDVSFEVVGERGTHEDTSSEEIDLRKVLDEADDDGQDKEDKKGTVPETINLEDDAAEQQVHDVPREEETGTEESPKPSINKAAREYHCPICFDPPDTAVMTPCGHIFCVACLFQMVNSSRTQRKNGHCALCRSEVKLKDIRLVILRKKRVRRD